MAKLKAFPDTQIDEIEAGVYRINSGIDAPSIPGGFSFNQFLVVDDEPLLFHTGLRGLFPATRAAIETVMPVSKLRYVAYSHFEADECGALNEFLAAAPQSTAVCSFIGALTSAGDQASRPPRPLMDGEELSLGKKRVRWIDAPHLPHGWDCGYLFETTSRTLFCGDVFTQPGKVTPALTEGDIIGPSETLRSGLDYYAHGSKTVPLLEKLAATKPKTLACMHGSSFRGDGEELLRQLARKIN
jgi:flavorubredoxin